MKKDHDFVIKKINQLSENIVDHDWDGEEGWIYTELSPETKEILSDIGIHWEEYREFIEEIDEQEVIDIVPILVDVNARYDGYSLYGKQRKFWWEKG